MMGARKDIVVVGASAGGMEALQKLVSRLPGDLPAALFVVWHLSPGLKSILPAVLNRAGPLKAVHPQDGDRIEQGRIYVAPNDHHLLLEQGYVRLARGPKENRFRPAVDPLFRSAAYIYGPRVIGVILTGALDDGAAGLYTVKMRGGTAIVQEPQDAVIRSMPLNALEHTQPDYKVPAAQMGELIDRLVREPAGPTPAVPPEEDQKTHNEIRIAAGHNALEDNLMPFGELAPFTCPECNGVLTGIREGSIIRFRCHTGHALSAGTLLNSITGIAEDRLYDAIRALDETVMLLSRLGEEFLKGGNTRAAEECFEKARAAFERTQPIRAAAMGNEQISGEELSAGQT